MVDINEALCRPDRSHSLIQIVSNQEELISQESNGEQRPSCSMAIFCRNIRLIKGVIQVKNTY